MHLQRIHMNSEFEALLLIMQVETRRWKWIAFVLTVVSGSMLTVFSLYLLLYSSTSGTSRAFDVVMAITGIILLATSGSHIPKTISSKEHPFPDKFMTAVKQNEQAWQNFQAFSPSHKRQYQMWITSAKRGETRERRIEEAVRLISKNVKSLMK